MTVNLTKTPAPSKVPSLSKGEKGFLGAVGVAGVGVGGLGLASSFASVSKAAERWGFTEPWMLPVGIDLAIPVFTAANLLLIRMNMPLAWVRWVPWALTMVTCWLNVAAGDSLSSQLAHGTMPLLWVVLSEVAAHIYASRIGAVTGTRMEKIRRSRWLLAFPSTFALWRRMTLWEITSYPEALECEKQRQLVRADLLERYGKRWKRKAPRRERVLLNLGELAPADTAPVPEKAPEPEPVPERAPAPEQTPEAPKPPRRRAPAKSKSRTAKTTPRLSFDEHLAKARELTADWTYEQLKADPLRAALGCGQDRSRQLRDTLRAERDQNTHDQELAEVAA